MGNENFDAEWAAEEAKEEDDRRRKAEPAPALSREDFLAWRSPRTVEAGPTRLDNPLWQWLVRTRWDAYNANATFKGPSPFDAGPMWCFHRFGMSETQLPDGRVLHIAGEHEDSYDPDFFIYNDVTVLGPGDAIGIYGYSRSVFPPTDFHTATLMGDAIFIIGCLGYPEQRAVGSTPVFRLALDTFNISRVDTHGEAPGWIYKHAASVSEDGHSIIVTGGEVWLGEDRVTQENVDTWSLSDAGRWTRLTALDWQRWTMLRVDRKRNRLWDVRQEAWNQENSRLGLASYWRFEDAPDLGALKSLYRLDGDAPMPEEGPEHNMFRVVMDGVTIRFTEESFCVHAIVEGRLSEQRLADLQRQTLATLERLDGSAWLIETA